MSERDPTGAASSALAPTGLVGRDEVHTARPGPGVTRPVGADPRIGQVIGGRYRVVARLGAGGMGVVYRAEHTLMDKPFAVKLLHAELCGSEELALRFEREAKSASRLDHPNIIRVTDFGREADGTLFLVMELLEGPPLSEVLAEAVRLPLGRAVALVAQILDALAAAHAVGVVHRDLKPDNVIVSSRPGWAEQAKLLDFGIAKLVGGDAEGADAGPNLTRAGTIFGTPAYMAPEQITGEPLDARADLYAVGVVLFELLAGRCPFAADDLAGLLGKHLSEPPPRLSQVAPDLGLPEALDLVVQRALAKRRDDRFADANEFRSLLLSAAGFEPVQAVHSLDPSAPIRLVPAHESTRSQQLGVQVHAGPVPAPVVLERPALSRRNLLVAGAGLGVALVIGLGVALRPAPAPAPKPPAPAERARLTQVERAIERGDLPAARALLQLEVSEHPQNARAWFLQGQMAVAEKRPREALGAWGRALDLDPGFASDRTLHEALRGMLEQPAVADDALTMLCDKIGGAAADILTPLAERHPKPAVRVRAFAALEKAGKAAKIDRVAFYSAQLRASRTCPDRRLVVRKLIELADPRVLPILRKEKEKKAGLIFKQRVNACMDRELEEGIAKLGG